MCGLSGSCSLSSAQPPRPELLRTMLSAIRHRGPDEAGLYLDDRAGLGHVRLSIIDLSSGTQPIHNEDGSLWIVFNGELFNYPTLRQALIERGHRFYTTSDTEVIVHLYEEYGPACLERMNGQFALALWNSRDGELFLARDRVGIRPLHYTTLDGQFYFASEIKALLTVPGIRRQLDPAALAQVFTVWAPLGGRTAFQDIHELPPGHSLTVKDGRIDLRRYWQLTFPDRESLSDEPIERLAEQADALLTDAIRIRLRADVPVGAYLSGGLDSSGIVATIAGRFDNDLQTFGIRFDEAAFDEGGPQQQMVAHLNVRHTELTADNDRIGRAFAEVIYHAEKPLLRTAPVPLFLLSQAVRRAGLKVVLTGEGADEVFGGYNIFREAKIRRFWAAEPDSTTRPALLGRLYPYIFDNPRLAASLPRFFAKGLDQTDDPLYSHAIRWAGTAATQRFFSPAMRQAAGAEDVVERIRRDLPAGFDRWHPLGRAQYLESTIFLSNYLLSSQGDRMAMAHSLEIRVPYLDHRLIEFMSRVPARWKVLGLNGKHLLKKMLAPRLPASIVQRSKHPYRAPIAETLLGGHAAIRDRLSETALTAAGVFDAAKVGLLIDKLQQAPHVGEIDAMALSGIVSTQILYDTFIEQPRSYAPLDRLDLLIDRRRRKDGPPIAAAKTEF